MKAIVRDFLHVRRVMRKHDARIKTIQSDLAIAWRTSKQLEHSPFNSYRIDRLRVNMAGMSLDLSRSHETRAKQGQILVDMAPEFDAATTLAERLELLNANWSDCVDITGAPGLIELLFAHDAEDSAAHRNDDWKDAPLGNAVRAVVIRTMTETAEGREVSSKLFDETLAPGGLFYGVPTYRQQPDGTMARQAPALVLHDTTGSRVIERMAGKGGCGHGG